MTGTSATSVQSCPADFTVCDECCEVRAPLCTF